MEDFEFVEIDLDSYGVVVPPKNDKIALIDADTLAYTACLASEEAVDVLPKEFYTEMEWDSIINNPSYDADKGIIYNMNLPAALNVAEDKLKRILDNTGCIDCELHFTIGRANFRYKLSSSYKSGRTGRMPAGLYETKKALLSKYNGQMHSEWEADDYVVYAMKAYPSKYILVAMDKDVYNSIPGKHYNYYESAQFNKSMSWIEISEDTAKVWPYIQTLTGDATDNVLGIKGIGPAKAAKLVKADMSEAELWKAVTNAWEKAGMTSIDAILTMNLVNMHLLEEVDGKLQIKYWMPKEEE